MATKKTEVKAEAPKKAAPRKKKEAPKGPVMFKGWEATCVNNVWRYICPNCGASLKASQLQNNPYHRCPVCGFDAEEV